MDLRDYIRTSITFDKKKLVTYKAIARLQAKGKIWTRSVAGRKTTQYFYKGLDDEKEHYASGEYKNLIWALQEKRYAEERITILENNIAAKEEFCRKLIPETEEELRTRIPLAYWPCAKFSPDGKVGTADENERKDQGGKIPQSENPYNRENLKIITSFGLYVRSKGELVIAEMLYSLRIEFYYERALVLSVIKTRQEIGYDERGNPVERIVEYKSKKTVYPDFTIVLPDGTCIYWEHKGMLSNSEYAKRDIQKEIDYNRNGIYQSHNLIVTAEGPDNQFDTEGVRRIIDGWLMPLLGMNNA